jgi:hypothetical protein
MTEFNILDAVLCVWAASITSEVITLFVRKEDIDMMEEERFSCLWSASSYFMLMTGYVIARGYVNFITFSEVEFYEIIILMTVLAALVFKYRSDRLVAFAFLISSALMLLTIWFFRISPIIISLLYLLVLPAYHLQYLYRKSKSKIK